MSNVISRDLLEKVSGMVLLWKNRAVDAKRKVEEYRPKRRWPRVAMLDTLEILQKRVYK